MLLLSLLLPAALTGCTDKKSDDSGTVAAPPFGIPLVADGQLYAGVASIDISPQITETFQDLNGDHTFNGCINEPDGPSSGRPGCDEPFNDANGNGVFDAIWIAGYGNMRGAMSVHDPLYARALVLALDGEYIAIVSVDSIGLLESRTREARTLLAEQNFDPDRVLISSSHSHQSPDVIGIWGDQDNLISGINEAYIQTLPPAIYDAVETAARSMVPVSPTVGQIAISSVDPDFNGTFFGGNSPNPHQIGTIDDIRDPVIVADLMTALAFDGPDGRLATVINFASHPEVVGDDNDAVSADYVSFLRQTVEAEQGGTAMFLAGALGGMQSAVTSALPAVNEDGSRVTDENGDTVWINEESWELAQSQGVLLAQSVPAALTDNQAWDQISIRHLPLNIPVSNIFYKLAFRLDLLDTSVDDLLQDASCPGYGTDPDVFACVPAGIWLVQLGPVTLATFPGELLPELFWGVPDEPSMSDASLRTGDPRWDEHDADCDGVAFADCKGAETVGDCDCLHYHAEPYTISDAGAPPLDQILPGTYRAAVGITNGYCGYIVPFPDFNTWVSQLTEDGDHYEETNSCTPQFAPLVQEAYLSLTGN